jgi:hypothetical protein
MAEASPQQQVPLVQDLKGDFAQLRIGLNY